MSFLGPFLLLLGPLVVIHELGHFLVAKLFGVKCERFSVGFGPPIFRYRMGETEYVLAWLPLGGYVKMLGESPDDELAPEEAGRSFSGQSPLRRTLIALAGPAANLILSIVVVAGVLMTIGWPTRSSTVGSVLPDGPADRAGIQSGDRIVAVGDAEVSRWEELTEEVVASGGQPIRVVIDRGGVRETFEIDPDSAEGTPRIGVLPVRSDPVLVFPRSDGVGFEAGLRNGDRVREVNGESVPDQEWFARALGRSEGPLRLTVARPNDGNEPEQIEVVLDDGGSGSWSFERLGATEIDYAVLDVVLNSPAQAAGIEPGDIFLEIGGQPVASVEEVKERIQESGQEPIPVEVLRGAETVSLEVAPQKALGRPPGEPERLEIGVRLSAPILDLEIETERVLNPLLALQRGSLETWGMFVKIVEGVTMLVTREVGLDAVAGPIGIGQLAASAFEQPGWLMFLQVMAFISVNLAIINLLPIPVLDGGHIVFAAAEAISGGPLGVRAREIAQTFGLSFILLLMGFAFWNDIARNWQSIARWVKSLL